MFMGLDFQNSYIYIIYQTVTEYSELNIGNKWSIDEDHIGGCPVTLSDRLSGFLNLIQIRDYNPFSIMAVIYAGHSFLLVSVEVHRQKNM